ncbi:hypothetical protein C2R74_05305 [Helicobacter pylori]|nr:hypothetical protein C2R74_05305 [Helicobacter pylori]
MTLNLKNTQSVFCDQNNKKLSKSKRQSLKKRSLWGLEGFSWRIVGGGLFQNTPYPLKRMSFTPIFKNFLIPLSFRMFFDFRSY